MSPQNFYYLALNELLLDPGQGVEVTALRALLLLGIANLSANNYTDVLVALRQYVGEGPAANQILQPLITLVGRKNEGR
jgi:hypothetical protein